MRRIPNAVMLSLWLNAMPPLLASVAVGAVAGEVIGKFAGHRVDRTSPAILTAKENAMSQSHLVVDFPIKGPAIAKALPGDCPR